MCAIVKARDGADCFAAALTHETGSGSITFIESLASYKYVYFH